MLHDAQKSVPEHLIAIDRVGVRDIEYPVRLATKVGGSVDTVAMIAMSVSLPREFRGTHMSRFIEILNGHGGVISSLVVSDILTEMLKRLTAEFAYLEFQFPYFLLKRAPISNVSSLMNYGCKFIASANSSSCKVILSVTVPIMSLCPCSKEISDYGAHNQRGQVEVQVQTDVEMVWIEDVVELVEQSASCDLYPLLKRPDEKFVTEKAFDNPKFVEDIVREVAHRLQEFGIDKYRVEASNFESIHNHSAYACIDKSDWGLNDKA